jgi:hypothetical protein
MVSSLAVEFLRRLWVRDVDADARARDFAAVRNVQVVERAHQQRAPQRLLDLVEVVLIKTVKIRTDETQICHGRCPHD